MKYKKINEIERKMIFEAHQEDRNWREVARSLGVNEKTAYIWLRNEQASPKRRGGSQTKKTQAIVDFLTSLIEEKPSITLREMQENIRCSFNFTLGINTVKNWLDGELFSLKNMMPTVDNMNKEENRVKRAEYIQKTFRCKVWRKNLGMDR